MRQTDVDTLMIRTQSRVRVRVWVMVFSGVVNIGAEQRHSDTEIAIALTLQHTLHLGIDMEACSHPIGS